ncbi:MAG: M15 family metallopeptidase [Candidatus Gastranaerophilales bacterium]|nr:M15 family metallopeptidase [Candidatus Gastranaerophilales bacterium]
MIDPATLNSIYKELVLQNSKSNDKATAIRLARAELLEIIENENGVNGWLWQNGNSNVYLNSIFEETSILNGTSDIFENIDFDKDDLLTDEELINFAKKDKEEQKEIMDELNFIFENIDANNDGIINEKELNTLNGGINEDCNAEAIKKLMVMMDMNIEESVVQEIQKEIDLMYQEQYQTEEIKENPSSDYNLSTSSNKISNTKNNVKLETPEDYANEIAKKENKKNEIETQADADIKEQENIIKNAMLDSGISEEVYAEYEIKNAEYDTKIIAQDTLIAQSTMLIQDKTAQIGGITSTIAQYNNQIQNLTATKSNGNPTDTERNERIDGKINNLNNAIKAEEAKQEALEAEINAEKDKIETAKNEKEHLEMEQSNLLDTLTKNNQDKLSDETKTIIEKAKNQIEQIKIKKEQDIASLDAEILTLKTKKNEIERKAESDEIINENKESNFDENGKRIGLRNWPKTEEEYAMYGLKTPSAIRAFEKCDEKLKEAYIDLSDWCREQGIHLQVCSSFRTREEQIALYDNGNNSRAAKPGSSLHEKGYAIDINPYSLDGTTKRTDDATYELIGRYWTNVLGYEWGGDWKRNTENWHFQIG